MQVSQEAITAQVTDAFLRVYGHCGVWPYVVKINKHHEDVM